MSRLSSIGLPLLALCTSVLLAAGCGSESGPEVATVQGTVTLDGEPLADATVLFQPENGRPSQGVTDDNGHYELKYTRDKPGAKIGKHTVKITTGSVVMEDGSPREILEKVPARYNTETTLTENVSAGENTIDFELQSE